MLSLWAIILGLIATAGCVGCSDSKTDSPDPGIPLSVVDKRVVENGIVCQKEATSTYFNVVSGHDVTAVSSAEWITVSVGERTKVNSVTRISLDIAANTGTDTRVATVTVSTPTEKVSVTVSQGEAAGLVVGKVEGVPVSAEGGKVTVTLASTEAPKVAASAAWIQADESRAMTERTMTFNVAANHSTSPREAELTFTVDNLTEKVAVMQNGAEVSETGGIGGNTPEEIALSMGMGWNLGNQMDAYNNNVASETAWGNPKATPELFVKLREAGISTVRIPVTWLGKVGAAPDYKIEAAWLDRVAELVGYAHAAGLNVIINIHHDGADSAHWLNIKRAATDETFNAAVVAQLTAMWQQIARRFSAEGSYLMFEAFNEIHDGGWGWGDNRKDGGKQYLTLNGWNQAVVDAIRSAGGENATRWIGVPAYCTNADLSFDSHFKMPADPAGRLMLALHNYDPYDYTLEAKFSEWGHTGKDVASYGTEKDIEQTLSKIKTSWIDKGVPVYFGEMGCVHRSASRAEAFRLYYLEYFCKACRQYLIPPVYWDNGSTGAGRECSGLFNRTTGDFVNNAADVVAVMVKGFTSSDPSYTLSSVYASAPL